MRGRDWALLAATGVVVLAVCAAAFYAIRSQQAANAAILLRLDEVRAALAQQASRSGDLSNQVTELTGRVGRLEADNRDLHRQVAMLARRKPVEVAEAVIAPPPLEITPLAPLAEHSVAIDPVTLLEPIPITWATDWSSYQPAGIVAPPPQVVLSRRLTDPAFMKKLYYSFGMLQAVDGVTTIVAVNRGAREVNPLLSQHASNPAVVLGVKAASVAGTVLLLEQVRKNRPVLATVSLIALNATLAVVAVNNVSVVARQDPRN